MIHKLYTMYDRVSGTHSIPFGQHNDECAIRYFKHITAAQKLASPSDYELYKFGSFDDELGTLELVEKERFLLRGVDNE